MRNTGLFNALLTTILMVGGSIFPGCATFRSIHEADFSGEIFVQPGDRIQLSIGVFNSLTRLRAHWTVESTEFATITPISGILSVNPETPEGATIRVHAGSEIATVYVFKQPLPRMNLLAGYWMETKQISCQTSEEIDPVDPIKAVLFFPNRKFTVTWRPYKSYRDYWGSYTFDASTGAFEMRVHGGNNVPDDFDGVGTAVIEGDGTLLVKDIWLGTRVFVEGREPAEVECGHRLVKTGAMTVNDVFAPIR
jgi:hypothetical protein